VGRGDNTTTRKTDVLLLLLLLLLLSENGGVCPFPCLRKALDNNQKHTRKQTQATTT
jgi:hypothetical protein